MSGPGRPVRVLLCDDVAELRELVAHGLRRRADLEVVGAAADAAALAELAARLAPDVVVTDLQVPGASDEELVRLLAEAAPSAAIVVFSGRAEPLGADVADLIAVWLDKTTPLDELAARVAEVGAR